SASQTAVVTVEDNVNPVISCVGDQTVYTDLGLCTYAHSGSAWDATAADNCSVTLAYVLSGATTGSGTTLDGVVFNLGVTIVTWTATDGSGNTDVCSLDVEVEDNENPNVIVNNFNLQLDNTGNATLLVSDIDNGSSDNCTAISELIYQLS